MNLALDNWVRKSGGVVEVEVEVGLVSVPSAGAGEIPFWIGDAELFPMRTSPTTRAMRMIPPTTAHLVGVVVFPLEEGKEVGE